MIATKIFVSSTIRHCRFCCTGENLRIAFFGTDDFSIGPLRQLAKLK